MSFTRRSVLSVVALAQSNLLGGCFGDSGTEAGQPSGDGGSGGGGTLATETPTATATETPTATETETPTATPTPVRNAALAQSTTQGLAEYEWLRTGYDAATRDFRVVVNGVLGAIDSLDAESELSQSDADTIQAKTTDVAEFVNETLAAHFSVEPALKNGDNVYVQSIRRAIRRGDADAQRSALGQTRLFYRRASTNEYIDSELSRRPAYDTLYSMLVPGDGDRIVAIADPDTGFVTWAHPDKTESNATDGVDHHVHDFESGHRYFTHAHAHGEVHPINEHANEPASDTVYGYDGEVDVLEDTETWRDRMDDYQPVLTDVFGPVRSGNRQAGRYVFVGPLSGSFTGSAVYVESFGSTKSARAAVEASLDGPLYVEGTATFGGRDWMQTAYNVGDATLYAYRVQAGPHVVTVDPSRTVWGRRPNWNANLKPTWLGAAP